MARLLLLEHGSIVFHGFGSWPTMPLSIGLFVAVAVLVGLCAHAPTNRNSSKKLITKTMSLKRISPSAVATQIKKKSSCSVDDHEHEIRVDISAQVPLPSPLPPLPPPPARRGSKDHVSTNEKKGKVEAKMAGLGGGFGEGGLWQKSILRGEKCQPPEFSGVIFYDSKGNQIEITR